MVRYISILVAFVFISTSIVGCGPEPDTVTRTQTLADGSTITSTYSGDDAEEYLDDLEDLDPVYDNDDEFYAAKLAKNPDYYEYGNEGYGYAPQGYQPRYPEQYNSHLSDVVMGVMIGSMLSNPSYRTEHRTTIVNKTVERNKQKKQRSLKNQKNKKAKTISAKEKQRRAEQSKRDKAKAANLKKEKAAKARSASLKKKQTKKPRPKPKYRSSSSKSRR